LVIRKSKYKVLFIASAVLIITSCSTGKYIPEGKYLLNKVEVKIDNKSINKEEVRSYIRQKGNLKILGMVRFHLWLYNLSSKKKENGWLKKIGEAPVVYDEILTQRTNSQLYQYFHNKGYYNATIDDKLTLNEKKRKADLKYIVKTGAPYRIRNVNYHISNTTFRNIFFKDTTERIIQRGKLFDVDLLEAERVRIVNLFKNKGYYYFNKDYIFYLADTALFSNQVDIDLRIQPPNSTTEKGATDIAFTPFRINNIKVSILQSSPNNKRALYQELQETDTLKYGHYSFYSSPGYHYRPELFLRFNKLLPGGLFRLDDVKETFNALNRLKQFRFINIQFEQPDSTKDDGLLDCYFQLSPLTRQFVSFDVEGTNTSGNLGVAGNLNYMHRNLFHGAEIFRANLRGALERQQTFTNIAKDFNTVELGVETSLTIPKLIGPGRLFRYFGEFLPQTVFTLGYNFQRRPIYTRTISNLKFGYDWKTSNYLRHTWNLFDFNMIDIYKFDADYINSIKDLYIKSSFTDHLVFAANYTLVYNTQRAGTRSNYTYIKFSVESAGNLLGLITSIGGFEKSVQPDTLGAGISEYYKIFNKRFAQYIKTDLEFRYGYMVDKYNAIVGRAFIGVGVPYGNFDILPFEKKYFTGGANGIRAWQVRSLGPGSYKAPPGSYPNQLSDIKLEANLEYRFHLMRMLEGALFFDAGNIWAINDKDNREGAGFEPGSFYKQIALGTGTGLRFDFDYFIFRVDLGMKLHDPAQKSGNGWIIGNRRLKNDDFNLSFAIGYPF